MTRRRLVASQVRAAAELARALNLRALEVRPDGSFRVELPVRNGEGEFAAWEGRL
jgi:hypothetical protein